MSKPAQQHEHSDRFAYGGPTAGGPTALSLGDEKAHRPGLYLITDRLTRSLVGVWVGRFPDICGPVLAVDRDLSVQRSDSLESSNTRIAVERAHKTLRQNQHGAKEG